jgi:SPOR domain
MRDSGLGPAPQTNLDEFERRSREALSPCAPTTPGRARAGGGFAGPLDVGSSQQSHLTPGDETSIVGAEELDDFRRWWRQSLTPAAAENRPRGRRLTRMAIGAISLALIGSTLAFKGGAPRPLVTAPVSDTATVQNSGGSTAGTPADITALPPAGVSGATPVAAEADAQAARGVASTASVQTTDPEAAPRVSARPERLLSSAVPNAPKPPAKPPSKWTSGPVRTTQPAIDLPVKRPGKNTARVVVGTTEADIPRADADTPTPPLPIGTPAKLDREATENMTESAEAARQSPNPFLRALGDLFGAQVLPARQSIDPTAIGSTGSTVELGAPRPEAEAKRDIKRLNARYGSALRGSTVGLRKVLVNGETVYRLHVVGLPRDKAAALCARVKGEGGSCSIGE